MKGYLKKVLSYQGGQAMTIVVILFLSAATMLSAGVFLPVLKNVQNISHLVLSKQSFNYGESMLEDASYRIMKGMNIDSEESFYNLEREVVATSTITEIGDKKYVQVKSFLNQDIRKMKGVFVEGDGVSFNYGVQVGEGGVFMENTSSISGNLYSNGTVVANDNNIEGDVVSAGPSGLVDSIIATGDMYANTIQDSDIEEDAYYADNNISNTTVGGTEHPNSSDQPTTSLPISDDLISKWEEGAAEGEIISEPCPYEINKDTTIGPAKIECNLEINGNVTITLSGALWVEGDIEMNNRAQIVIDESLGDKSVPFIADNPNDRENSSIILIQNQTNFSGNSSDESYVLLISQNSSSENGEDEEAIELSNAVSGDLLLYAGHGEILLQNNASLKEVTAYKIHLQNSARVIYEDGLANTLFTSGPSGGFSIEEWRERK